MKAEAQASSIVPAAIQHARTQTALVAGAELENHAWFKALPAAVLVCLKNSGRLRGRLLEALVSEFGEPVFSTPQVKRFYCLSNESLVETAFCLGLAYEISMLGGALEGETLKRLTQSCDERVALKALKYATHSKANLVQAHRNAPTIERDVLEANGWHLLDMWACANAINPNWKIAPHRISRRNLGVVSRDSACGLVNAVLLDTSTTMDAC